MPWPERPQPYGITETGAPQRRPTGCTVVESILKGKRGITLPSSARSFVNPHTRLVLQTVPPALRLGQDAARVRRPLLRRKNFTHTPVPAQVDEVLLIIHKGHRNGPFNSIETLSATSNHVFNQKIKNLFIKFCRNLLPKLRFDTHTTPFVFENKRL